MIKFNAIVIDDQLEDRKEDYEALLGKHFNIKYVGHVEEIEEINRNPKDLVVIDLFLWSKGKDKYYKAEDFLVNIERNIPIVLVSKYWDQAQGEPIQEIHKYSQKHNIIKFLPWKLIAFADNEDKKTIIDGWQNDIIMGFNFVRGHTLLSIKEDDPIQMLHIADMQFGGKISEYSSFDDITIANHLKSECRTPKLIFITGDIAQTGQFEEYLRAAKWLQNIRETVWGKEYDVKKLIMIPGNHDCDFDAFAKQQYRCKLKDNNQYAFAKKDDAMLEWDANSKNKAIIDRAAFSNYLHFAHSMTGNPEWLTGVNHINFVNDYYLSWGIRIVYMNTMTSISPVNHRGVSIDGDACDSVVREINEKGTDSVFTIVLSHCGPYTLGFKQDDKKKQSEWPKVQNFLDAIHADLWLYGHEHKLSSEKLNIKKEVKYIKNLLHICTGSLRLSKEDLGADIRRGFMSIQLIREKGIVKRIEIIPTERNQSNFEDLEKEYYDIRK